MKVSELFPSKYLKAEDLLGKDVTVAIASITIETMHFENVEERHPVLWFQRASKGLVLKKTNAMTIAQLYGDDMDAWIGKRIILSPTQVRAFGKTQNVVTVLRRVPPTPQQPPPKEEVNEQDGDESPA